MPNHTKLLPITKAWGWRHDAECKFFGPDFFFSREDETREDRVRREARARRICFSCKVIEECRSHAEGHGEQYGVWGGTTESERARLRSRSKKKTPAQQVS